MFASCVYVGFAFSYWKMWISGKLPVLKDASLMVLGQISKILISMKVALDRRPLPLLGGFITFGLIRYPARYSKSR